ADPGLDRYDRRTDPRNHASVAMKAVHGAGFFLKCNRNLAMLPRDVICRARASTSTARETVKHRFWSGSVGYDAAEDRVPVRDVERALRRKKLFQANPERHTHNEDLSDA